MGLYSTIVDTQVKCFFAPCFAMSEHDKTTLSFYSSGGKLVYYDIGDEVPYDSYVYNYGKNFIIFDFRKYLSHKDPVAIFIKDGKVNKLIPYTNITNEDFKDFELVIDNYGHPLKINCAENFTEIVNDYIEGYNNYDKLATQYKKEKDCDGYPFKALSSRQVTKDIIEKVKLASKLNSKAFSETVIPLNDKWEYSKVSPTYLKIHSGYECGYIFENLTFDNLETTLKNEMVKLFEKYCIETKQHTLEDEIELYIKWLKNNNSKISGKEIKEKFKEFSEKDRNI